MQILVIEDEAAIADFLRRGLEGEGHTVLTASDGLEGERMALGDAIDLVVLDRMLPKRDGLDVLDSIRAVRPSLPVIMLTARGEIEERVAGLDRGATDYLTKPFAFDELAARVRAHLRQPDAQAGTRLVAAGIGLDLLTRKVERDGVSISLSTREFDLLVYLMRHAGQVCSHSDILQSVWSYDHEPGTNIVQVYVGYLRRRLARSGQPAPIETVRSVGYRLAK